MQSLRTVFVEAVLLVVCGGLLGLALNHRLVFDAFTGRLAPQLSTDPVGSELTNFPMPVLLDEVRVLAAQDVVLVDARPPELYASGHIAGALSLPMLELDDAYPEFRSKVGRERTIVTYCSGYGCQDSFDLAMQLILDGYQDVRIYEGGFPEWQSAGLPVAEGSP